MARKQSKKYASIKRSTGTINRSAPSLTERSRLQASKVRNELAEAQKDMESINTVYENYKAQFMRLKVSDPNSLRLKALNVVVNNLALALNNYAKECIRIKGAVREFS